GHPGGHVALDASDPRVRRGLVGLELRRHHVASLAAELHGLHVLDRAVGELGAHDHVHERGRAQEVGEPPQRGLAVGDLDLQPLAHAPAGEEHADRHEDEPVHEDDRDHDEDDDADVRVRHVAPHLEGKDEEPGDEARRHEEEPEHAEPMARDQDQERPVVGVVGDGGSARGRLGAVRHAASSIVWAGPSGPRSTAVLYAAKEIPRPKNGTLGGGTMIRRLTTAGVAALALTLTATWTHAQTAAPAGTDAAIEQLRKDTRAETTDIISASMGFSADEA